MCVVFGWGGGGVTYLGLPSHQFYLNVDHCFIFTIHMFSQTGLLLANI